jgi:hypothetical protein
MIEVPKPPPKVSNIVIETSVRLEEVGVSDFLP